jgi:hypothetical protein
MSSIRHALHNILVQYFVRVTSIILLVERRTIDANDVDKMVRLSLVLAYSSSPTNLFLGGKRGLTTVPHI